MAVAPSAPPAALPADPYAGYVPQQVAPGAALPGGADPYAPVIATRGGDPFAEAPQGAGLVANYAAGAGKLADKILGFPMDAAVAAGDVAHSLLAPNAAPSDHVNTRFGVVKTAPPSSGPLPLTSSWLDQTFGENIAPTTGPEAIAQEAGQGTMMVPALMAGPEALAPELEAAGRPFLGALARTVGQGSKVTGAIAGTAGGVGGGLAQQAVPDQYAQYRPLADLAGQTLFGIPTAIASDAAAGATRWGLGLAKRYLAPLTEAGRQGLAGQRIIGAATDPDQLRYGGIPQTGPDDNGPGGGGDGGSPIPGYERTSAQDFHDAGIAALEKWARNKDAASFAARAEQQGQALAAHVQETAPADASAAAPGDFFSDQLRAIDEGGQQQVAAVQQGASSAAAGVQSPLGTPAEAGAALQIPAVEESAAQKAAYKRLFDAVDPEGNMVVPSQPLKSAATAISSKIVEGVDKPATGEEAQLHQDIAALPENVPLDHFGKLRARINAAITQERSAAGWVETPASARLMQLKGSLDGALDDAVFNKASVDATLVKAGHIPPESTTAQRLLDYRQNSYEEQNAAAAEAGNRGGSAGRNAGAGPAAVPGNRGAVGAAAGGPGNAARPAGVPTEPPSLLKFIADSGGMKDTGGELKGMDADKWHLDKPFQRKLINPKGLEADEMARKAQEAGYFGAGVGQQVGPEIPEVSPTQLHEAMRAELAGRKVYSAADEAAVQEWRARTQPHDLGAEVDQKQIASEGLKADLASLGETNLEHLDYDALRDRLDERLAVMGAKNPEHARRIIAQENAEADRRLAANPELSPLIGEEDAGHGPGQAFGEADKAGDGSPARPAETRPQAVAAGPQGARPGVEAPGATAGGGAQAPVGLDADALNRYRAAVQATAEYKGTYRKGAASGITAPGQTGVGSLKMSPTQAYAKAWGSKDPAVMDNYLAMVRNRPDAIQALRDTAAFDVRKAAFNSDGTVDPKALDKWLELHADKLDRPEFAGLRQQFATAGAAQRTVEDAMANRAAQVKAYETSAARVFLKNEPREAVAAALGKNAKTTMQQLVKLAKQDPTGAALEGLKRAVADHIVNQYKVEGAGRPNATLAKFLNNKMGALGELFGHEGSQAFRDVANEIERTDFAINKARGTTAGSDTIANQMAAAKYGSEPSTLQKVVTEAGMEGAGALAGHAAGGPIGAGAGFLVGKILAPLRAAGLRKVDDLVVEAMLNPALARTLISKVPRVGAPSATLGKQLATQVMQTSTKQAAKIEPYFGRPEKP